MHHVNGFSQQFVQDIKINAMYINNYIICDTPLRSGLSTVFCCNGRAYN